MNDVARMCIIALISKLRMYANLLCDPQPKVIINGMEHESRVQHTSRIYGNINILPIKGNCRRKVRITGKKSLDDVSECVAVRQKYERMKRTQTSSRTQMSPLLLQ